MNLVMTNLYPEESKRAKFLLNTSHNLHWCFFWLAGFLGLVLALFFLLRSKSAKA